MRALKKKNSFTDGFFQASRNPVRKRKVSVRTFFICHKTTYNHVIKELCNFVHGCPIQ